MIPRHRPPFGLFSLATSTARSWFDRRRVTDLEEAYAAWLNVEHAVWIPSARYGIARTIDAHLPNNGTVYCPVFNCGAVFHAAQECRRDIRYVDCAEDQFLVDTSVVPQQGSAVILTEIFGQRFSAAELSQPLPANADMRIFDMAMSIPTATDMNRMRDRDVTVLSFGLGKSLYAGWGGLALTQSSEVASRLRQQRDEEQHVISFVKRCHFQAKIWTRTAAHNPFVYGPLRQLQQRSSVTTNPTDFSSESREWRRSSTTFNRCLAFNNLQHADSWADQRRFLALRYVHKLQPIANCIRMPQLSGDGLSHFCLRVPASIRSAVISGLWDCGIDVGTLFPFPERLSAPNDLPNAYRCSREVINLPLSNLLTEQQVDQIAKAVVDAVGATGFAKNQATCERAA